MAIKFRTTPDRKLFDIIHDRLLEGELILQSWAHGKNNMIGVKNGDKVRYISRSVIDESAYSLGPVAITAAKAGKATHKLGGRKRIRKADDFDVVDPPAKEVIPPQIQLVKLHSLFMSAQNITLQSLVTAITHGSDEVMVNRSSMSLINTALKAGLDYTDSLIPKE